MKAFISFLLVFAFLLIFLYSLSPLLSSFEFDQSKNIAMERAYSLEMNLKEAIIEGSREAVLSTFEEYLLTHPAGLFNLEELEEKIKDSVQEKILQIESVDSEDFEFKFFCGDPSSLEINSWKKKILEQEKLVQCTSCEKFNSDSCKEIINVNFELHIEPGSLPTIDSLYFGKGKEILLIAIYSDKFDLSSVSYLPISEVVSLG